MRRKPGTLLPLEQQICIAARTLRRRGVETFHGFLIAKELRALAESRKLTAHGTLYRALARLEDMGLLTSQWEDPQRAADAGRPRRRLYRLTDDGLKAAAAAETGPSGHARSIRLAET